MVLKRLALIPFGRTGRRWECSGRFPLGVLERLLVSPGYLTFYPGQRQVVAQAQPIQSAWMRSEERTGALGVLGLGGSDRTRVGGHGWTEQRQHLLPAARHRDARQEEEEEDPRQSDSEEGDRAAERLHHHHRWGWKTRRFLLLLI